MTEAILRRAAIADVDAMWRVRTDAILSVSDVFYPMETTRHWAIVARPNDFSEAFDFIDAIVCEYGKEVVGWGFVDFNASQITALFVSPRWQRNGFGAAITEKFEEMAVGRSVEKLELSSTLNAVAFYERQGFESIGEIPYNHPAGFVLPSVRMRQWLPRS